MVSFFDFCALELLRGGYPVKHPGDHPDISSRNSKLRGAFSLVFPGQMFGIMSYNL